MPKIDRSKIQYQMRYLPASLIIDNSNNIRFEDDAVADTELANSIHQSGIIQPLVVRPLENGKFEILCGFRRYKAAKKNHLEFLPVIIIKSDSDDDKTFTLVENIQRKNLTTFEITIAVKKLVDTTKHSYSTIGKKIGMSKSWISKLNKFAKQLLDNNEDCSLTKLPVSTYLELVNKPDLLKRAEKENWTQQQAREEVNKLKNAQNEKSGFIHRGKIKNTPAKDNNALLPAYYKQSQLIAYKPIEFKDAGFTINAFYFDKNQSYDIEAVVEKLQELQNYLDFAIKVIREHDGISSEISDYIKEEFHDVL